MRVDWERCGDSRIWLEEMITGRLCKVSHISTSTDISLSMYIHAYRCIHLYKCVMFRHREI